MGQKKIMQKGVLPPEACINPLEVLALAQKVLKSTGKGDLPFVIEHYDEEGNKESRGRFHFRVGHAF